MKMWKGEISKYKLLDFGRKYLRKKRVLDIYGEFLYDIAMKKIPIPNTRIILNKLKKIKSEKDLQSTFKGSKRFKFIDI